MTHKTAPQALLQGLPLGQDPLQEALISAFAE